MICTIYLLSSLSQTTRIGVKAMSFFRVPSPLTAASAALATTAVLGTAALLAGCGGGTTSSKPSAPAAKPAASASTAASLASLPPAQILSKALAAAAAAGSVHFTATDVSSSGTSTYDQNASSNGGSQVITKTTGKVTIRVVAGVGYLRTGNAAVLAELFPGKSVSPLVGRWIAAHPGNPGYQDITVGITLASVLPEFTPTGTLTATGLQTVDGQSVIGVKGLAPATAGVPPGQPVTLYVMATGQPLPVSFQGGSGTDQETAAFSRWGQTVSTVAPANPLPITSVTGS
jgi:hypothetical protein